MTLQQAYDVLRLDNVDTDTMDIVRSLLDAVPGYIAATTGISEAQQDTIPLCNTVAGFLLRLWYYPEGADSQRLQTVIDNLLKSITVLKG